MAASFVLKAFPFATALLYDCVAAVVFLEVAVDLDPFVVDFPPHLEVVGAGVDVDLLGVDFPQLDLELELDDLKLELELDLPPFASAICGDSSRPIRHNNPIILYMIYLVLGFNGKVSRIRHSIYQKYC